MKDLSNSLRFLLFLFFHRDAEDAVHGKDGKIFESRRLKVQFPRGNARDSGSSRSSYGGPESGSGSGSGYIRGRGRGQPIRRSENRILVSGLPLSGSWQDLKDHMREAGEVVYADVYKDGTAVCEFKDHKDMKWAIKYLDDSKFKSHEVSIPTLFLPNIIHLNRFCFL